jgi:hypothetical protein
MHNKFILIYRIAFVSLSWFTIVAGAILNISESGSIVPWLMGFKYYTTQSNYLVSIWWILAILWHKNPDKLQKIMGPLKGAFTFVITITFVFFAVLLAPIYHPTGFAAFANVILHYLTPIAFIVDWELTEVNERYKWKHLLYWALYPLCYLIFALVHGFALIQGDFIYPFFDVNSLGLVNFIILFVLLILSALGMASAYIIINRKRVKT